MLISRSRRSRRETTLSSAGGAALRRDGVDRWIVVVELKARGRPGGGPWSQQVNLWNAPNGSVNGSSHSAVSEKEKKLDKLVKLWLKPCHWKCEKIHHLPWPFVWPNKFFNIALTFFFFQSDKSMERSSQSNSLSSSQFQFSRIACLTEGKVLQ